MWTSEPIMYGCYRRGDSMNNASGLGSMTHHLPSSGLIWYFWWKYIWSEWICMEKLSHKNYSQWGFSTHARVKKKLHCINRIWSIYSTQWFINRTCLYSQRIGFNIDQWRQSLYKNKSEEDKCIYYSSTTHSVQTWIVSTRS